MKVVIVGGVAGGASAAAHDGKEKLHVEIAMRFNAASARTKKKWLRLRFD